LASFSGRSSAFLSTPAYLLSASAHAIKRNEVSSYDQTYCSERFTCWEILSFFLSFPFLMEKKVGLFKKTERSLARVQSLILLSTRIYFYF